MAKPDKGARQWSDHRLIEEMRARDSGAFEEFFERFAPLLREEASRLRMQPALREEAVVQCLEQAALSLIKEPAVVPASLGNDLMARLASTNALERRVAEVPPADKRAVKARSSLNQLEAAQTSADAVKFGKRIRARLGQRRTP